MSETPYVPLTPAQGHSSWPYLLCPPLWRGHFCPQGPTCAFPLEQGMMKHIARSLWTAAWGDIACPESRARDFFFLSYSWTDGNTPFCCPRKLFPTLLSHPSLVAQSVWGEAHKLADKKKKKGLLTKRRPGWVAMWFYHIISFLFLNRAFSCMLLWFSNVQQTRSEQEVLFKDIAGSQSNIKPWQIVHLRCILKRCTASCCSPLTGSTSKHSSFDFNGR